MEKGWDALRNDGTGEGRKIGMRLRGNELNFTIRILFNKDFFLSDY